MGYSGNWTDELTGLVYLRARDYDPSTGQFLSVDPAVSSTQQPYAYANNSPLDRTDPTGLDSIGANIGAFALGALDGLTGGLSSLAFSATVPGYDCFVSSHEGWFTAGSVVAQVVQVIVMAVTTFGVGAIVGVAAMAARAGIKAAIKAAAAAT